MPKDVGNGSLVVVVAHLENIFISKTASATSFCKEEHFLVADEKLLIFCDFRDEKRYFFHSGTKSSPLREGLCRKLILRTKNI